MERDLVAKLKAKLKEKIDKHKDADYHSLDSAEMRSIATEILKKEEFHVYDEPFTSSEGKKQPDAIAASGEKTIVIEYVPHGDRPHEAKMERLLETKEMLQIISGKEVEFWLITTRISEPKKQNLESKGIRVFLPTPSGTWRDKDFLAEYEKVATR